MPGFLRGKEKAVVAGAFGVVTILVQWYLTGELNSDEAVTAVVELLSVLGVWGVRNRPGKPIK